MKSTFALVLLVVLVAAAFSQLACVPFGVVAIPGLAGGAAGLFFGLIGAVIGLVATIFGLAFGLVTTGLGLIPALLPVAFLAAPFVLLALLIAALAKSAK